METIEGCDFAGIFLLEGDAVSWPATPIGPGSGRTPAAVALLKAPAQPLWEEQELGCSGSCDGRGQHLLG